MQRASELMRQGYHCSEAILIAVGESVWGQVDESVRRASNSLSGGIGNTHAGTCGAVTGGALVIGLLHGRTAPDANDRQCIELAARFRDRFAAEFGATRCQDLRDRGYGSTTPCPVLVAQAADLLAELLDMPVVKEEES